MKLLGSRCLINEVVNSYSVWNMKFPNNDYYFYFVVFLISLGPYAISNDKWIQGNINFSIIREFHVPNTVYPFENDVLMLKVTD